MFKHILIPTDGSLRSEATAMRAIEMAKALGAAVTGMVAVEVEAAPPLAGFFPETMASVRQDVERDANDRLRFIADAARAAGVPYAPCIKWNVSPYEAIITTALEQGCDLIFMASHGRRGLSALLLGSETHKVLTHSKIPVLVYR